MKNKKSKTKVTEMSKETENLENIDINDITNSEEEYSENERNLLRKIRERQSSESYDSDYEVYGLHEENERNLLRKIRERQSSESYDSDYEVYGLHEENEQDQDNTENEIQTDSMESDIEGLQEDFDLPNEKAWEKKKKDYYSTDYIDPDYATINQKDLIEAEMEEEEARNIQKRLAEQLDDVDFGLDIIQTTKNDNQKIYENAEQFIKSDFSKLSKRQKQAIMQKESPEFVILVNDFKDYLTEAKDLLAPFLKLVKNGVMPNCPAISFIRIKYHLLLNYCINISFYLMLKAKRLPVNTHPVIKRLAQYRQLLNQLESEQGNLIQEIQEILKTKKLDNNKMSINEQKINYFNEKTNHIEKFVNEDTNIYSVESESDFEIENKYTYEKIDLQNREENKIENIDTIIDEGKRAITYQIAKNKGLMPHRKKEQRNPRVKHRNKYRKAKIRRKGAIREVRKEVTRYAGEISGIKASVKKSIKLK